MTGQEGDSTSKHRQKQDQRHGQGDKPAHSRSRQIFNQIEETEQAATDRQHDGQKESFFVEESWCQPAPEHAQSTSNEKTPAQLSGIGIVDRQTNGHRERQGNGDHRGDEATVDLGDERIIPVRIGLPGFFRRNLGGVNDLHTAEGAIFF